MKAYSGEIVLILTIALCAKWSNIVSARQQYDDDSSTMWTWQAKANLLPSVMQAITAVTEKPILVFADRIDGINKHIKSFLEPYTNHDQAICKQPQFDHETNRTTFKCYLLNNNILRLDTTVGELSQVYVSVIPKEEQRTNDILCDINGTWLQRTFSLKHHTSFPCSKCDDVCGQKVDCLACPICRTICTQLIGTEHVDTTTNSHGTSGDLNGQKAQPTDGDSVMPIIIASIVSFIAGVGVCLLVLCLIGHFHGRLCLKFTDSSKYAEKTAKSQNQSPKSQIYTTSTIDMTEHEYLDLRCETMPHPNSKLEDVSTRGQKQPSAPNTETPTPMYETMASAQKEHVYSGLGKTEPNLETEYEHTSPNRSSEHMYSGMVHDKQSSDPTILQQVNTPDGIANTNGNQMHDTGDNEVGPNNYFVLEKEQHSTNQSKPGQGQGPDFGDIETAEDTDDYHSYHTLQKI